MMLALPKMTVLPNDVCLTTHSGQTLPHYDTKWSNIIWSEAKNIISLSDTSFVDNDILMWYNDDEVIKL